MRRFRCSIASMIRVVVFVAIGAAALRASTDAWDQGVFGATLLILLFGVLLSIFGRGNRRAYWLGFAVFGWAYLIASLIPPIASRLPTTSGLTRLAAASARPTGPTLAFDYDNDGTLDVFVANQRQQLGVWMLAGAVLRDKFVPIGHSLIALIFGFLGGHISRYLADREQRTLAGGQAS